MADDAVLWRIMPLLLATYFVSITDRTNLGIAAIQMNQDLGFGPALYGWGAGIFFASYAAFEIPSNLCRSAWRLTPNQPPTVTPGARLLRHSAQTMIGR
jgi:hypothetical protein